MDSGQHSLLVFFGIVTLLTIMPGPNGALLLRAVARYGQLAGVVSTAGILIAFIIHGALAGLGVSAFLFASEWAFLGLKYLGVGYLLYLGLNSLGRSFSVEPNTNDECRETPNTPNFKRNFTEGILTNLLNPKVAMFYLAAFPQFIDTSKSLAGEITTLVGLHSLVAGIWFLSMTLILSRMRSSLSSPEMTRCLHISLGIIFIWFGCQLLLADWNDQLN